MKLDDKIKRKGGPFDTTILIARCERCGKQTTASLRWFGRNPAGLCGSARLVKPCLGQRWTVYELTESSLERRFITLIPLTKRRCSVSLKRGYEFTTDIETSRFPLVRSARRESYEPCLAPRFSKYATKRGVDCSLNKSGETLFEWWKTFCGGRRIHRIRVREDLIKEDLARHGLAGLWRNESARFSERLPAEIGLQEGRRSFQSKEFNFQFSVWQRPGVRFRVQTATFLMGKRLLAL